MMKMNRILIASAILVGVMSAASFAQTSSDPAAPSQAPATQTAPPQTAPQPAAPQPTEPAAAPATASTGANQAANPTPPAGTPRIAPGSVIPVQLTKTIDAKKAKPGDEVVATVTMDLKTNSGEVVVPKDTKVVGHVTESQARSKDQKESQVAIAFDHAVVKGADVNLPMSIQAVIAPPSNDANNNGGGGANSGNGQAAPAGGGGAAQSPMNGGRTSSGQTQPPSASSDNAPNGASDTAQQAGNARPQITGNTKGVVGISNLTLAAGENATQGSVLSSEKNNVKVESGTMLLLKVNQ
jgi:hypothetical protein